MPNLSCLAQFSLPPHRHSIRKKNVRELYLVSTEGAYTVYIRHSYCTLSIVQYKTLLYVRMYIINSSRWSFNQINYSNVLYAAWKTGFVCIIWLYKNGNEQEL